MAGPEWPDFFAAVAVPVRALAQGTAFLTRPGEVRQEPSLQKPGAGANAMNKEERDGLSLALRRSVLGFEMH
jgi:hypothetical protein